MQQQAKVCFPSQGPSVPSRPSASTNRPSVYISNLHPKFKNPSPTDLYLIHRKPCVFKPTQFISYIEPEFEGQTTLEVCQKILPPNFNYITNNPLKTQAFYEFILTDSKSAQITHIKDQVNPSRITYSKLKILKVMNPTDWHQGIYDKKSFPQPFNPSSYSYLDYQAAWYQVLWFESNDHPWFISFSKNCNRVIYPFWFINWWDQFGLTEEIFPIQIQESYSYFKSFIFQSDFPTSLKFASYFQIPWIFCWDFQIQKQSQVRILVKVLKIRWWDKFSYTHTEIQSIKNWFSENPHLQNLSRQTPSEFINLDSNLLASPAQSSTDADLQTTFLQFAGISSANPISDSNEEENDNLLYHFQFAQDPYQDSS